MGEGQMFAFVKGSRRAHSARRSWVEPLEDRRLLTVSTFFASASLQTSDSTPHASPISLAPYPIDIHVSGVGNTLNNVTLTVNFSGSRQQDLDLMLVSPTGQS